MSQEEAGSSQMSAQPHVLSHAPEELTRGRLIRLGEGIGKVVYASEHWVVKRERSPFDVVALIWLWRILRSIERQAPGGLGRWLRRRPARQIRFLRRSLQAVMRVVPTSVWLTAHVKDLWKLYRTRDWRGEALAERYLAGTHLVPERVTFPPTLVRVGGWPGELTVSEATQRVDATLDRLLARLAHAGRVEELDQWIDRFLETRQGGWRRGLFSMDSHLKNFGVIGDQVVLLDTGGLTNRWEEIEKRLAYEETVQHPHRTLGLGRILKGRPEVAARFDARWKATVNRDHVRRLWPNHDARPTDAAI